MKNYFNWFLLLMSFQVGAVKLNNNDLGEVLLLPYYTVNNGLNTLVSISNTTILPKAVKINIREGLNGYVVLSYNVYLDGNDSWAFALAEVSGESTELATAQQFTSDNSCAPFVSKSTSELFVADYLVDGPQDMQRAREGFIEVIEMGVVEQDDIKRDITDGAFRGDLTACNRLQQRWEAGGIWHEESGGDPNTGLGPATGGLVAQLDLINVTDGINYSIPYKALGDFFADDQVAHEPPMDADLSLDAAQPIAQINANGALRSITYDNGYDAVSALLMSDELVSVYGLDYIVAGQTDIIFTQPTRRFYISELGQNPTAPYTTPAPRLFCNEENYGGTILNSVVFNRESRGFGTGLICTGQSIPAICGSVFVQSLGLESAFESPRVTASNNWDFLYAGGDGTFENGFVQTRFNNTLPLVGLDAETTESVQINGLPVMGFSLIKFTNAGAVEGLLAQYGGAHESSSRFSIVMGDVIPEVGTSNTQIPVCE
ncbi:hypothetical protein OS175_11945 [Marinicella sp. S1101]|nr:hypothetical protein [Marinicella marina]MCX7554595.1 hypothetical protein [Marinicella marina]